jgi:rhamnogalacturonan endolyase
VRGNDDGTFSIPNVRPGKYTLHAYATGVFGELVKADVTVQAGKPLDVGMIDWAPERLGKQVWEIGVPDRSAGEFLHGNEYWHWGWYLKYPQDFPHDVNFTIGKSDFRKDWNYAELPRATDDIAKAPGGPTTWTVNFDLAEAPKSGKGILRMGICGTGNTTLTVGVNGSPAGDPLRFRYNSVINRDSVVGLYTTREVTFDATLLKQGENKLTLSIPGGPVTDGIEYDYLRLELAE